MSVKKSGPVEKKIVRVYGDTGVVELRRDEDGVAHYVTDDALVGDTGLMERVDAGDQHYAWVRSEWEKMQKEKHPPLKDKRMRWMTEIAQGKRNGLTRKEAAKIIAKREGYTWSYVAREDREARNPRKAGNSR